MARAFVPVIPYILITVVVLAFYKYALDTGMNEFTAPVILPLVLIAMILYDKMVMPKEAPALNIHEAIVREHEKNLHFTDTRSA